MEEPHAHPVEGKTIINDQAGHEGYMEGNLNLVAQVISDKELKFKIIKNAIMDIWGQPKGVNIIDVGRNKVVISFQDSSKGFKLWRGYLINMHTWTTNKPIMDVDHRYMKIWIQMHGGPFNFMSKKTTIGLGEELGTAIEAKDPWKNRILQRSFLFVKDWESKEAKLYLNAFEDEEEIIDMEYNNLSSDSESEEGGATKYRRRTWERETRNKNESEQRNREETSMQAVERVLEVQGSREVVMEEELVEQVEVDLPTAEEENQNKELIHRRNNENSIRHNEEKNCQNEENY
ncbi:hypothetical protein PIB30_044851 [Stylosanthes scabra]|uniref:DUF4283 domain-containing protein n=1 Tax=Stylosanthes scabra TaxID=79078 RepID=A0ABU6ZEQ6_9FABA|nr:hypothetical protein [Stylosanthes scabra]